LLLDWWSKATKKRRGGDAGPPLLRTKSVSGVETPKLAAQKLPRRQRKVERRTRAPVQRLPISIDSVTHYLMTPFIDAGSKKGETIYLRREVIVQGVATICLRINDERIEKLQVSPTNRGHV